jgi:hypothetical protein
MACAAFLAIPDVVSGLGATQNQLGHDDRVRLAEARRLRMAVANRVWPSWEKTPFAVLLVTDSVEFLLWHAAPSADFVVQGYDSLLQTAVLARPGQFSTNLLATFPAVTQTPTIVIGQPRSTGKSSSEWVLTLLHEHFHQLQFAYPGYYKALDTLGLSRGDQTGMWMLNYPFPYDSAPIQELIKAASLALAAALDSPVSHSKDALQRYYALRTTLREDDRRYLEFQLWQEGVARYVEYRCAALAAQGYTPTAAFTALPDYVPYANVSIGLLNGIMDGLRSSDLGVQRRISFYALGAGLALLLDREAPGWKERYFSPIFTLEHHFRALPASRR